MKVIAAVLLASVLCCAPALGAEFGKWVTESTTDNVLYAATTNDSGALLGEFCFPGNGTCVWLIGMETRCNSGDSYTVLANSDAGSAPLKVLCDGQLENGSYRYVFGDFEEIDGMVKRATRIGFAVPLQTDEFRVFRFPLQGAKAAIAIMRSRAERKSNPQGGRKEETL